MNTLRRKYRRFRLYNESSRPGLLRLIDSIVGLLKILLLLTLLGAIYLLLQDSPLDFFSSEKETEPASNVAESSAIIRTAAQLSRNTVDANPSASPARVAGPDAILNLNDSG